MRMALRRTVWLVPLALLVTSCGSCERKPKRTPGAPGAGFAERSGRLATIPQGHEMGDGVFSSDGRHVAYVATKDGRSYALLDEKASQPYDAVRDLTLLPGQGGLAFVARKGGKELVVVNGEESAGYDGVGKLQPTPDGKVVHSALRDGRWLVVAGKREVAAPGGSDPSPLLGAGGKRLAYVEQHADTGKSNLRACASDLTGCVSGSAYDALTSPSVDPRGARLAVIATRDGKQAVATMDLERPDLTEAAATWFDEVLFFALSDDGRHIAFLASRGGRRFLVRESTEIPFPEGGSPLELVVSRSGRALLTAVVDNQVVALLDGKQLGSAQQGVYFPVFSPDGRLPALVAGDATNALVVNGLEGPAFDKVVTPRFTPDGSRVVYRARQDGQRFVVVADAQARTIRQHPRYQAVFEVQMAPDGKSVGYGVRTGQELWWKVEPL